MIDVKLANGFACQIADEALDDYELFEDLVTIEEEPNRLPGVIKRLIGKESYAELKEANRVDGRVSTAAMSDSLRDIIAFPKANSANCLMMETPADVRPDQLEIMKIRVDADDAE